MKIIGIDGSPRKGGNTKVFMDRLWRTVRDQIDIKTS